MKLHQSNPIIDKLEESIKDYDSKFEEVKENFNEKILKTEKIFTDKFNNYKLKIDKLCTEYEKSIESRDKEIKSIIEKYVKILKVFTLSVAVILLILTILIGILFIKCSASTSTISEEPLELIMGIVEPLPVINEPEVVINLTDITSPSNLTADQLNDIIASRLSDIGKTSTSMSNIGEYLVKMETEYKVNALFCLAVATLESGHGTSYAARNKNNLFGIMSKGSTRRFSSVEEGILYWGKLIREKYINTGRTTISSIGKKYCAKPTHWTNSVSSFMTTYASYVKK